MKNTFVLLLSALIFLSLSCSKKNSKVIHLYSIDFPIAVNSANSNPPLTNFSYSILPVEVDSAFDTRQLVMKDLDKSIFYFSEHLWSKHPAKTVDSLLSRYIKSQNIFKNEIPLSEKPKADYVIRSNIYQILIIKTVDDLEVLLYFNLELIENKSNHAEISSTIYSREILEEKDLNLFADLVSQIFRREFDSFSSRIISYFQKQASKESS
jgi:ABC-type uncharacterized transport system auxiliary subunit